MSSSSAREESDPGSLPSFDFVEKLGLISDVSLGFIAFSIGNEFRLEH